MSRPGPISIGPYEHQRRALKSNKDRHVVPPSREAGLGRLAMAVTIRYHCGMTPMTVVDWLLDSDPAIRWQAMRDLVDAPGHVVASERARVATEGWGAHILALQDPVRQWSDGSNSSYIQTPDGSATFALVLLRDMGLDPTSVQARSAVALIRDKVTHYEGGRPFFAGEVEPCINGRVLALGAYFDEPNKEVLCRLLAEQLDDGGWNCEAPKSRRSSFHTTICVLEGLLAYERARGADARVTEARMRGEEYLLQRRLCRSLSSGEVIDPAWTQFSFPVGWHYDVLRGLDYLRGPGVKPDDRISEAIELVEKNRSEDGRWLLQRVHSGQIYFEMDEGLGKPSRWNTLRALRVLKWAAAEEEGGAGFSLPGAD